MRKIFKMLMRLDILQKRIRRLEVAEIIDKVIKEYYDSKDMPVPQWKQNTNPQWWVDYLHELGLDASNRPISE
tara:strand:- start:819 stop:1037 length:219 start_codon:yes stop_codon:yes gene_type:complete